MFSFAFGAVGLVLQGAPLAHQGRANVHMSIAVFGATGGVGGEVAFQALGRGESVRALVRDKTRLKVPVGSGGASAGSPLANDAMSVFEGTVTSAADVAKVFESGDVTGAHALHLLCSVTRINPRCPSAGVVIALGGKSKDVGPTMLTDGTANVINACIKNGVKRISVVTSIGAGDSENQAIPPPAPTRPCPTTSDPVSMAGPLGL